MLANVAPKQCVDLYQAVYVEEDLKKGKEIYKEILPALNVLESFPKPVQALKYGLSKKGLNGGYVRRPRMELNEEEKTYLSEAMKFEDVYKRQLLSASDSGSGILCLYDNAGAEPSWKRT